MPPRTSGTSHQYFDLKLCSILVCDVVGPKIPFWKHIFFSENILQIFGTIFLFLAPPEALPKNVETTLKPLNVSLAVYLLIQGNQSRQNPSNMPQHLLKVD